MPKAAAQELDAEELREEAAWEQELQHRTASSCSRRAHQEAAVHRVGMRNHHHDDMASADEQPEAMAGHELGLQVCRSRIPRSLPLAQETAGRGSSRNLGCCMDLGTLGRHMHSVIHIREVGCLGSFRRLDVGSRCLCELDAGLRCLGSSRELDAGLRCLDSSDLGSLYMSAVDMGRLSSLTGFDMEHLSSQPAHREHAHLVHMSSSLVVQRLTTEMVLPHKQSWYMLS